MKTIEWCPRCERTVTSWDWKACDDSCSLKRNWRAEMWDGIAIALKGAAQDLAKEEK